MKRFGRLMHVKITSLPVTSTPKAFVSSVSIKSIHLPSRHHNSNLLVNTRHASSGFLNAKIRDAQLIAKKAEKDYSAARFDEKKIRNRLSVLESEMEELEEIDYPEDDKALADLEHKMSFLEAKIKSAQAQLNDAVIKEEACFKKLSESLHESIDRELFREWRYITRTLFASLIGCIGGLVGSVLLSSQRIDSGIKDLKQIVNEASIDAIMNGVDKALLKSQKNFGELSDGIEELNVRLSKTSTSDALPHVIEDFEELKAHVYGIEDSVTRIDMMSNSMAETLHNQSIILKNALEMRTPPPGGTGLERKLQELSEKVIAHIDRALGGAAWNSVKTGINAIKKPQITPVGPCETDSDAGGAALHLVETGTTDINKDTECQPPETHSDAGDSALHLVETGNTDINKDSECQPPETDSDAGDSALLMMEIGNTDINNDLENDPLETDIDDDTCAACTISGGPCKSRATVDKPNSHVRQAMIIGIFTSFLFYILHG